MHRQIYKSTPKRLAEVFQDCGRPLYFVTMNTWNRRACLDNKLIHEAFVAYAEKNALQGRAIGKYVIMPDHLHFFVRGGDDFVLTQFGRLLKQNLSKVLKAMDEAKPCWQPGFFDHLLRHDESYAEKWNYIHQNPVRAKLVKDAGEWPYQGEITVIDRA